MKSDFKKVLHIGVLGAMQEEVGQLINYLHNTEQIQYGDLKIFSGEIKIDKNSYNKIFLSIAWSGWGKVSSARAATRLVGHKYEDLALDFILFTGVAGSVSKQIKQWDIILADEVIQYDLDARPLFQKFFIPIFNKDKLSPDKNWFQWIFSTLKNNLDNDDLQCFNKLHAGLIGTGDRFISDKKEIIELKKSLPNLKAVEMEGCSVAQVAEQEKIPWIILRVISDSADESAPQDFNDFLKIYNQVSPLLIKIIIENFLKSPKFF